jgi:DNA primase
MDKIEAIKAKIDIVSLVSEYVELRKAGRNYKGLSPFKSENTPSFVVSPEKEIAYCFSTNQGGDIFEFYQLVENVSFKESVRALSEKAGVELDSEFLKSGISPKDKQAQDDLYDIHNFAAKYFQSCLWNPGDETSQKIMTYLEKRGISQETIRKYKIGLAPESYDGLGLALLKEGFTKKSIVDSGVCYAKGTDYGKLVDRFRERLIIPIADSRGRLVAFGGRITKKDQNPKYLNSPETDIYKKNKILFGFDLAKDSIRKKDSVIVVEGYFDQIACFQAGFENVVAVSGTALTEQHLRLLGRFTKNIMLCFDTDEAGKKAMIRSAELGYEQDFNVKVLRLRGGHKDPAESINSGKGEFERDLENAADFFDYLLENYFSNLSLTEKSSPEKIQGFIDLAFPIIAKIDSVIIKDLVLRKFSGVLEMKVDYLYVELEKFVKSLRRPKKQVAKKPVNALKKERKMTLEEQMWSYFFLKPESFEQLAESIYEKSFIWQEKQVYKLFLHYYNEAALNQLSVDLLKGIDELYERYSINILQLETKGDIDVSNEINRLFKRIVSSYVSKRRNQIVLELKKYGSGKVSSEEHIRLLEEFNQLNKI